MNNLCSVNCTWSEHGDITSTFGEGGGGGGARDNILSILGSIQYFRGYHEYIGGYHYLAVFNMN